MSSAPASSLVGSLPATSAFNDESGVNGANKMFVECDEDGVLCIFNSETRDLVIDIVGYIA